MSTTGDGYSAVRADMEKHIRMEKHKEDYREFKEAVALRRSQRQHLASREHMWAESIANNEYKIRKLQAEIESLLEKNEKMEAAKSEHIAAHAVEITEEEDAELEADWQAFFELEADAAPA
ncbi:hypothetical protein LTR37_005289 [Vermiconidia calcicola]|uniref:Uncharacterized protein n=1 Tax=Vermiconidia calcicola TaxID=1690605 RepID=A0ACC3NJJ4_9PEZI|nr:hypothetical protein LTR37_005289 [Vermiconidia calcicola]